MTADCGFARAGSPICQRDVNRVGWRWSLSDTEARGGNAVACVSSHRYRAAQSTVVLCALWLAGCGVSHPQTAAEFRTAVAGAYSATKDTFEVDRPLEVASSFQKLASDCLARTIRTVEHQPHVSYSAVTTTYKPTVQVTATNAELHVQQRHRGNVINVSKEPDGGYFLLVADARPIGASRTRVDLYRPTMGHGPLIQAVRNWAAGTGAACPDLMG